jgi:hypothetical protein
MNRIVTFIISKERKKNTNLNVFDSAPEMYQYCYSKFDMCRKYYNAIKNYNDVKVHLDATTTI